MQKRINHTINIIYKLLVSTFFYIGIIQYFMDPSDYKKNSVICFFIVFLAYSILNKKDSLEKRELTWSRIFCYIYFFALFLGNEIYDDNSINTLFWKIKYPFIFFASIVGFAEVVASMLTTVIHYLREIEYIKYIDSKRIHILEEHNKLRLLLIWFVMLLSQLPYFLAYFPGIMSYDIGTIVSQIYDGGYSINKHHPPVYTFLLKLCAEIGQLFNTQALLIYSIISILFMTFCISYSINYMIKNGIGKAYLVISAMFYAVNPVIGIMNLVPTKDVYLAGFMCILVVELHKLANNTEKYVNSKKSIILLMAIMLLLCLFRNNVAYALILCIPFILVIYKTVWKKVSIICIVPLVIFFIIDGPLFSVMGISPGEAGEALCVPIQQIGYVVTNCEDILTEEEIDEVNKYFQYEDIAKEYNPRFADPVKTLFDETGFSEDKSGFIKLWVRLFFKFPVEYVNAFLSTNVQLWYQDAKVVDGYALRRFIETGNEGPNDVLSLEYFNGTRSSILPGFFTVLQRISEYQTFACWPIFIYIFSLSTPIWISLFVIYLSIIKRDYKSISVILPGVFIWLTFIAGPVSNFRYIYPIFLQYPIYLWIGIKKNNL